MKSWISELIDSSPEDLDFEKAIECLKVLRESCIDEEEPTDYNHFYIFLKK